MLATLSARRSYHGATGFALAATGDYRRKFGEGGQSGRLRHLMIPRTSEDAKCPPGSVPILLLFHSGFVKFFNPEPTNFNWSSNNDSSAEAALVALEAQSKLNEHANMPLVCKCM